MSKKPKALIIPPKLEDIYDQMPESVRQVVLSKKVKDYPYKKVTIDNFYQMVRENDRKGIAQFVYDRFHQRYILPFEVVDNELNSGFAQMAVCCLMIEALESFRNGWGDTTTDAKEGNGSKLCGGDIFNLFFGHYDEFSEFRGLGKEFYKSIRCGILHQAESQNGWRILRTGPLLDKKVKRTINSTIFLRRMKKCLKKYYNELETVDENSEIWQHFKTKMTYIIQNCVQGPLEELEPTA